MLTLDALGIKTVCSCYCHTLLQWIYAWLRFRSHLIEDQTENPGDWLVDASSVCWKLWSGEKDTWPQWHVLESKPGCALISFDSNFWNRPLMFKAWQPDSQLESQMPGQKGRAFGVIQKQNSSKFHMQMCDLWNRKSDWKSAKKKCVTFLQNLTPQLAYGHWGVIPGTVRPIEVEALSSSFPHDADGLGIEGAGRPSTDLS